VVSTQLKNSSQIGSFPQVVFFLAVSAEGLTCVSFYSDFFDELCSELPQKVAQQLRRFSEAFWGSTLEDQKPTRHLEEFKSVKSQKKLPIYGV